MLSSNAIRRLSPGYSVLTLLGALLLSETGLEYGVETGNVNTSFKVLSGRYSASIILQHLLYFIIS